MSFKFGNLTFESSGNKNNLLAKPVQDTLDSQELLVSEIDPDFSDTGAFCGRVITQMVE